MFRQRKVFWVTLVQHRLNSSLKRILLEESMAKCKVCSHHIAWGNRFSFSLEQIKNVCEPCFDTLMKEKGYAIHVAPEQYKVYIFDNGGKYRQYIPRAPPHHVIPKEHERNLQERVVIDMLNRKLETTAKRIEQKFESSSS